ncbi:MAG: DUF1844 domain-containing protein [Planctomycetia bacterium]|nr:DUF1844 domain-containing protein [Planctomycetia bacterium]
MPDEKPRIIVDEDWKSQVECERELARHQAEQPPAPAVEQEQATSFPPASLELLVSMFATEALMAMGQIPHPVSGKHEAYLPQAKHLIDLLQVLEDKTKGNRTDEESKMFDQVLHELRLAFVAVQKHLETLPKTTA